MKTSVLLSFLPFLAAASPLEARGTGAPFTLFAVDPHSNHLFDEVNACGGDLKLGSKRCASPDPNAETAVVIYPSNTKAVLNSKARQPQNVYVFSDGHVFYTRPDAGGRVEGLTDGFVINTHTGFLTFQGKSFYGCYPDRHDRVYRLFVDLHGDLAKRPGCKPFNVVAKLYHGQPVDIYN